MPFQFNPPDGYRNTVTFPQKPANETAFRDQMMQPLDQLAAYINGADPLPQYGLSPFSRQGLINGGFDIWQRGLFFSGRNVYTADRWFVSDEGGSASYTVGRNDIIPGDPTLPANLNPRHYLTLRVISLSSGSINLGQKIEDVRTFAGQKITLSMYVRSPVATSMQVAYGQVFGSGGSPTVSEVSTVAIGPTFSRVTVTFSIPSVNGKTIGANSYLFLQFLRIPSSGVVGYYDIAMASVNAGETASSFSQSVIADELARCQRYYEKTYSLQDAPGTVVDAGTVTGHSSNGFGLVDAGSFKVAKRTVPTMTLYSPFTGFVNSSRRFGDASDSAVSGIERPSTNRAGRMYQGAGTLANGMWQFHWTADAEL
ncbi:hypothetical protein HGI30_15880 [Paenibacillus albicereus]|uniref:Uncharacterized protein n=1 Tax=Paenibacillus albicereus TaxID=2726185 RepID=A0A6H2GZX8_9BACL|nr:hypothetical protein [Paenibacillus albicereus]QJC52899.1 hypothetical protein HGI30_15880 [Paenibacillus albicereus]